MNRVYDDGKSRKCGRCHELKPYNEFYKESRGGFRGICKKCFNVLTQIRIFNKKLKVIDELYGGIMKGKCQKCDTDIRRLPALSFHHIDKNNKEINWGDILYLDINYVINKLESENVELLCENCHSLIQTKIFNNFKDFILDNSLFNNTGRAIENAIFQQIDLHPQYNEIKKNRRGRHGVKEGILNWIKKRFIIEHLFNGRCIGCDKINVKNNLPAFDFHHRDDSLEKKFKWSKFSHADIYTLIKIIKKESIVAICSNCHRMMTNFHFAINIDEIFTGNLEIFTKIVKKDYNKVLLNINSFIYPEIRFKDPLKIKFGYKDVWREHLIIIFNFIQQKGNNRFSSLELQKLFKVTQWSTNKYIRDLKNHDLVEFLFQSRAHERAHYKLTEKGLSLAKQIKNEIF